MDGVSSPAELLPLPLCWGCQDRGAHDCPLPGLELFSLN